MNTAKIIEMVEAEGGALILENGTLRLIADKPLPAEIVQLIRDNKAEVVATLEGDPWRFFDLPDDQNPHRNIKGSFTRPAEFLVLDDELIDIWQMIVFGAMRDGVKTRDDAEGVAWADIEHIRRNGYGK